ncbi:MAG: tetratricopeptide repeat-containing sulfotransferase family protein [Steroidobacteraceae bacterium]
MTQAINPTAAGVRDALGRGDIKGAAEVLTRIIASDRRADWAYNDLITLFAAHGRRAEAEQLARRALMVNPDNYGAHDRLGTLLSEQNDLPAGEWHFRRALELGGQNPATLGNLALNLMQQGRTKESEAAFSEADKRAPGTLRILAHWSKLREVQGDLAGAERLLAAAEAASSPAEVNLLRAQYHARAGRDREALAILEAAPALNGDGQLERGRLYERLGRHAEAWRDFVEGKQKLAAEAGGLRYDAAGVAAFYRALKEFFVAANMARLPSAKTRRDVPQPVFIMGAPRSGTTLIEQVLACHPAVTAGGERPWLGELRQVAMRLSADSGPFPACLARSWTADQRHLATVFRDHYLARAEAAGLFATGKDFFTDKMPFNEMYLPLVRMAFPDAKVVLVRRDPRDVAVSMLANHLSHGFNCGYRIEDIVRHLAATAALVAHYEGEPGAWGLVMRYEDFVAEQEAETRRLLDHLGLPFDAACLRFHESVRYAPTPSYARVAEPLSGRSIGRHRHYVAQLAAHLGELGPALTAGGYRP